MCRDMGVLCVYVYIYIFIYHMGGLESMVLEIHCIICVDTLINIPNEATVYTSRYV